MKKTYFYSRRLLNLSIQLDSCDTPVNQDCWRHVSCLTGACNKNCHKLVVFWLTGAWAHEKPLHDWVLVSFEHFWQFLVFLVYLPRLSRGPSGWGKFLSPEESFDQFEKKVEPRITLREWRNRKKSRNKYTQFVKSATLKCLKHVKHYLVGAQFLPGILDANLCKNKQTNNKLTNIEQITWYLFYLFVFVYFCIN